MIFIHSNSSSTPEITQLQHVFLVIPFTNSINKWTAHPNELFSHRGTLNPESAKPDNNSQLLEMELFSDDWT